MQCEFCTIALAYAKEAKTELVKLRQAAQRLKAQAKNYRYKQGYLEAKSAKQINICISVAKIGKTVVNELKVKRSRIS